MSKNRLKATALVVALVISLMQVTPAAGAINVGSLLKLFGIGYVVDLMSDELNQFVNTVTLNRDAKIAETTKVVPILSAGTGGYIGAAQVAGPKDAVEKVEAVGQIEVGYTGELIRAKILVPLANKNPLQGIKRVSGVGISAIIDIKL